MKFVIVFAAALVVAGCQSKPQQPIVYTVPEYVVVKPPTSYYNCPKVKVPDAEKMTNRDLGAYMVELNKANAKCRGSLAAVQSYVNKAEQSLKPAEKPVD